MDLLEMLLFPKRTGNAAHGFAFVFSWVLIGTGGFAGVLFAVLWLLTTIASQGIGSN